MAEMESVHLHLSDMHQNHHQLLRFEEFDHENLSCITKQCRIKNTMFFYFNSLT